MPLLLLIGFSSAIIISLGIFLAGQKRYVKVPPQSSAIVDAIKTTTIAFRERGFQNAKPSHLLENGKDTKYDFTQQVRYTDTYVEDVRKGIKSCKVSPLSTMYSSTVH